MTTELLSIEDLPERFEYPSLFVRVVQLGLANLEPWLIVGGELLRQKLLGLRERYPNRRYVPFAIRVDCDDVACWDPDYGGSVLIVHDHASAGDEIDGEIDSFAAWFRQAVEEMIEWE